MASTLTVQSNNNNNNNNGDDPGISMMMMMVDRAQWLRAAILGATDGLLSTTALMLGVSATDADHRSLILSGLAGALAGACSMALGEFVSVSTQRDIETNLLRLQAPKTEPAAAITTPGRSPVMRAIAGVRTVLPSPLKAAAASGLAFLSGAAVPLLLAALVGNHAIARTVVIVVAATMALAGFGGAGATLGGSPALKVSAARVVVGGWIAMALTYALLKPFDKERTHPK